MDDGTQQTQDEFWRVVRLDLNSLTTGTQTRAILTSTFHVRSCRPLDSPTLAAHTDASSSHRLAPLPCSVLPISSLSVYRSEAHCLSTPRSCDFFRGSKGHTCYHLFARYDCLAVGSSRR
ncbi:uncharacterized protein ARMOST_19460 [Armillaria ostoyae]|uniref:Uncharacterized protein n=1 Tax=Armillaria ostoyae TaxID=47428 RepID=A0A284S4K6_ARMOS|nr:uncharacterized protein ARMOST_19460 [Armillaria ostoyae]